MFKTISTAPYLAALLVSNTIGLEFVSEPDKNDFKDVSCSPSCRESLISEGTCTRLRKLSSAAANLYESMSSSYRDERQSCSQNKAQDVGQTDDDFRPVFDHVDKTVTITRLYASKTRGKTCLTSVQVRGPFMAPNHTRNPSTTSAAESIQESPPRAVHNASFHRHSMHTETTEDAPRQAYVQKRELETLSDDIEDRLTRSVKVSEDTTYGTMAHDEPSLRKADVRTLFPQHDQELKSSAPISGCLPPLQSVDWNRSTIKNEGITSTPGKGHARNESVCSIWTVGSSPESDDAPVPDRRKPLQLQSRPPMPNFSLSSATQQAAAANQATKTATTASLRGSRQAWESWDEDFRGETSIAVPYSIRDSQASLRGHLDKLRRFSTAIDSLAQLRATRTGETDTTGALAQADALLAIASSEGGHDSADELVGRLLGRSGKVTLDDALLDSLIERSEALIVQLSAMNV